VNRVHLDHNATTPLRPEARAEFLRAVDALGGNPSSVHASGRAARAELDDARERIAAALGVEGEELVFTSGGTEANNTALFGALPPGRPLYISAVEHSSVREVAEALQKEGRDVTILPVDPEGRLDVPATKAALEGRKSGLLSVMGVLEALPADSCPLWHADCVQMLGKLPLAPRELSLDLASFSAHKVGGPLGVGVLWCSKSTALSPRLYGGGQESGLRSGTENLPAIAAAAVAIELAVQEQAAYTAKTSSLARHFWGEIQEALPAARLLGPPIESTERLPNTLCVLLPKADGRVLVPRLDLEGLEVSAGSACSSGSIEPSPVLMALGHNEADARAALRLSLGRETSAADLQIAIKVLRTTCG
jgi:cysteine desulfurase